MADIDPNRQTGRTTKALMSLFAEVVFLKRDGCYISIKKSHSLYCMNQLVQLINNELITKCDFQKQNLYLTNGYKIFFAQSSLCCQGLINPIIVYDHFCHELVQSYLTNISKEKTKEFSRFSHLEI